MALREISEKAGACHRLMTRAVWRTGSVRPSPGGAPSPYGCVTLTLSKVTVLAAEVLPLVTARPT